MGSAAPRRIVQHPVLGDLPEAGEVRFTFDGQQIVARDGDTIASALLAHGVRQFRTMPETGRARSYFCGVGRCPDCAVVVDGALNVPACSTAAREGMVVTSQAGLGEWTVGR